MKRFIIAIAIIGLCLVAVSAQVSSGVVGSPPKDLLVTKGTPAVSRARIVGRSEQVPDRDEPHSVDSPYDILAIAAQKSAMPALNHARAEGSNNALNKTTTETTKVAAGATMPVSSASLSQEYRVGVGDVLDVQLPDLPTKKSTLFTVREGGVLDYPLAGESIAVAGLTADEIAIQLRARIKVLENPKVVVKVRDYFSHSVIVTGLVSDPGAKFLRREALPLYVVLVEAQPRPEAISATIARAGQPAINVDLIDHEAMSTLVMPGDVIKVVGPPAESAGFFYAGGALNLPGQKAFHAGITLTQAILASGGVTRDAGSKAKVARQGSDGRLTTTEYNLRQIQDGRVADPALQRGDRITVSESH